MYETLSRGMELLQVLCIGSAVCFLSVQLTWAQEKLVQVNVSIGSLAVGLAPYVIAKEKGYFHQEGIEPRFILMQSSIASKAIDQGCRFKYFGFTDD